MTFSIEYFDKFLELHDGKLSRVFDSLLDELFVGDSNACGEEVERRVTLEVHAFVKRQDLVCKYAWAVPTQDALDVLAAHRPILEIGAGTGYWAYLLREHYGVDILAYDKHPPLTKWTGVLKGRPVKARKYPNRTLFLCWPPYSHPMATESLKYYQGQTVIYVGEWNACTADDEFHELLEAEWTQTQRVSLPNWIGIRDEMFVFERN